MDPTKDSIAQQERQTALFEDEQSPLQSESETGYIDNTACSRINIRQRNLNSGNRQELLTALHAVVATIKDTYGSDHHTILGYFKEALAMTSIEFEQGIENKTVFWLGKSTDGNGNQVCLRCYVRYTKAQSCERPGFA